MIKDWYGKTAVCTSVFGAHDYHGAQAMIDGVDYHYITDGLSDPPPEFRWIVHHDLMEDFPYDNRRKAKVAKIIPYYFEFLNNYNYVIWIDGDMQILKNEFVPEILSYMNTGLVVSPHFDSRSCAYGEATIRPEKYAKEPMDAQVDFYKSEGFPENYGLYECGVMARDMRNQDVKYMTEFWFEQNIKWSYQDQISLPFSLWKTGFKPDILPKSFRDFNWTLINAHRSEQ